MDSVPDAELDVCGVCCPLPLIQLSKTVAGLTPGQTVEIVGNDPVFEPSVRDFCQVKGHEVIRVESEGARRVSMLLRIGGRP